MIIKNISIIAILFTLFSFAKTVKRESRIVKCFDTFSMSQNYSDFGIGVDLVIKETETEVTIFKRGLAKEIIRSFKVKIVNNVSSDFKRFALEGENFLLVLEKQPKISKNLNKDIYQGLLKTTVETNIKFASKPEGTKEISEPMSCEMFL